VQVDPVKLTLKVAGTKDLKLKYYRLLSNLASIFNLRRYIETNIAADHMCRSLCDCVTKTVAAPFQCMLDVITCCLPCSSFNVHRSFCKPCTCTKAGAYTRSRWSST